MKKAFFTSILFFVISLSIIGYKIFILSYSISAKLSSPVWRVSLRIQFEGKGKKSSIRVFLPPRILRERIYDEKIEKDGFKFQIREGEMEENLIGLWEREKFQGRKVLKYEFSIKEGEYPALEEDMEDTQEYLNLKENREEREKIKKIVKQITSGYTDKRKKVNAIFQYLKDKEFQSPYEKVKFFITLLKASGIPSRIVGGIILEEGLKRDINYWAEVFIDNLWYPFCIINNYAWEVPHNYLILFWGDKPFIKEKGTKNLKYVIWIEKDTRKSILFMSRLGKRERKHTKSHLNVSIPLSMQEGIRKLLVVPIAALVVIIFRNLIGIRTFGTFTPILISLSFYQVELIIGLAVYFLVIFIGYIFRSLVEKLQLLFVSRLSIILTITICAIITILLVFYHIGILRPSSVFFLPMVIITMTIERFYIIQIETGIKNSLLLSLSTVIVSVCGYFLMSREIIQLTVYYFPEILLCLIGIFILLGKYTGLRLSEIIRFRELLKE